MAPVGPPPAGACTDMQIIVLGSAAGGGFPQWNCNCGNCRRARAGDPAAQPRSAVLARGQRRRRALVPAERLARRAAADRADAGAAADGMASAHSPIAGVVLTNADVDHVAGLLSLRERQPLRALRHGPGARGARRQPDLRRAAPDLVARRALPLGETRGPLPDPAATPPASTSPPSPFRARSRCGSRIPRREGFGASPRTPSACGWASRPAAGRSITFPAAPRMPPTWPDGSPGAELRAVRRHDLARRRDAGERRRREDRRADGPHEHGRAPAARSPPSPGSASRRKIFIHINNTNPVLLADSAERAAVEAAGWEIAEDGMEIVL